MSASIVASCSFASAIAVAIISSPMSPSFIGTRIRSKARGRRELRDGRYVLEQSSATRPANRDEDDQAGCKPDGACVARAGVGDEREHPHGGGQRRPHEGGERERVTANPHAGPGEERSRQIGSRMRRRITASWAAVNAISTPNE